MTRYHLAQANIAEPKYDMDAPEIAEFVANLDPINTLADASPGFVWRLQTEEGNALDVDEFGDGVIVNMSVWEDSDALFDYVYHSDHTRFMARRKEWFHWIKEAYMVMWWIPAGHIPTPAEAKQKLEYLRANGPSAEAFTFKQRFPAPTSEPIAQE